MTAPTSAFDFNVTAIDGQPLSLAQHRGKVLLIVNTASECGFTPQLGALEGLWRGLQDQGLVVLGFPCNQSGGQEPLDDAQIQQFCDTRFGVTFPMMAKIEVNGPRADPLYQWLTTQKRGLFWSRRVKWNYTKFVVGRDGRVRQRVSPMTRPEQMVRVIQSALRQKV